MLIYQVLEAEEIAGNIFITILKEDKSLNFAAQRKGIIATGF